MMNYISCYMTTMKVPIIAVHPFYCGMWSRTLIRFMNYYMIMRWYEHFRHCSDGI